MDFDAAVKWVTENKALIIKKAHHYCQYGPYEPVDYIQTAYEASLVAALRCQAKDLEFRPVFWSIFKTMVREVTPFPMEIHGSNSIPSDFCSNIEDEDLAADFTDADAEPLDFVELMYQSVCDYLPKVEREILALSLGVTGEGALNKREIAEKRKCTLDNVKQTIRRALVRIESLINEGVIEPMNILKHVNAPIGSKFVD
ncbi:MAG: sigma-70 family RNA polymerase sigma factor [Chlorobium sp.]|nr:sigma-70 family RNA polymerase sigma factor [Chlorobium sp.]